MPGILDLNDDWTGGSGSGGGGGGPALPGDGSEFADAVAPETGTLQILLSEGRIEGLVDGLKSIYLDGTPIMDASGNPNFHGIALALVAGTNTQAAVKGITGTESETAVGVQVVQATPVIRTITSNPSAVRIRIAVPALKVVDPATGKSSGHTVQVKVERKHATYTGGAWQSVPLQGLGHIQGGPFSTKYTRSYRIDTPAAGSWDIRVSRLSTDDADAYHASQTWWEAYTEVVDARLRYPNSAVLSIRVNAKQFRNIPQVNCHIKGVRVQVPQNYDPATRAYATTGPGTSAGSWDGSFKEAWTDNPAWVFFDAASKVRYGAGSFLQAAGVDKWALYGIAQWCDTLVPDGKGGTEPRMTANLYLQSAQNAIKALQQLASVFWAVVYYASGLVIPVADADTAPVALFTNANVKEGRFAYEGTARQARHTSAVVKFINPDLGYQSDAAVYEDEDGIARFGLNVLDVQGVACTSQGQALRLAKWAIFSELMAPETVAFTAGLEGAVIAPGDVIQVADQFRAGNTRSGGRIVAATTTMVTLDGDVTLGGGTYTLRCQTATGMESRTVSTGTGTHRALTVSTPFSSAPVGGWLLQSGATASLWRILAIRRGEGLDHDIVALKHDPAKYAALGLTTGDVIPRPVPSTACPPPAGLSITATTRVLNDRQVMTLEASWTLDGAVGYRAEASRDYGPWESMTVAGAQALLDGIQPGVWRVRVAGDWRAGTSTGAEALATITASATRPGWVDAVAKGDIQTPNYVAGSAGNAPTGAKIAATPFTSTLKDGSTITAQAEFGEALNVAGHKLGPLANRTMTAFNRILNGTFYQDLTSWTPGTDGSNVFLYDTLSSTGAGGSAALVATTAGVTESAYMRQGFNCPPTTDTVNLTLATRLEAGIYTATGSVVVKLFNSATGTETTLATWNYAAKDNAWTARSVDITSHVSGGGDFVLQVFANINTNNPGSKMCVDNFKIVL